MAKFEMEMEIQGFKLRVKGDREQEIPHITAEVGKQLAGMLQPPAHMLDAPLRKQVDSLMRPAEDGQNGERAGRSKPRSRRSAAGKSDNSAPAISWQHDPAKWGTPKQAWKASDKALWLLYVLKQETSQAEASSGAIVEAFNARFREFGPLVKSSMPRMLGGLKTHDPALVMSDNTNSPIAWYLTEAGTSAAERLVTEAKGTTTSAQGNSGE